MVVLEEGPTADKSLTRKQEEDQTPTLGDIENLILRSSLLALYRLQSVPHLLG